jgi:uroporphyrin-III C-methyltransferase/precorrin-2 dehydrogenase/sirohydrochlorin ferrochelatase
MGYAVQLVGLEKKRVLVAGGGGVAATKLDALLQAGARVHLVARDLDPEILPYLPQLERVERRDARVEDVEGAHLVIAATDDRLANRSLADAARARGILVNAVDDPQACTFFAPAVVRRGAVTMAISTEGGSPLLAAQLRRVLEAAIPRSVESIAELFLRLRGRGLKGLEKKKKLLRALADRGVSALVDRGETERALDRVEAIAAEEEEPFEAGTVAIVGAGPGAKALLTLRALDRIQRADVILHDALVDDEVLDLALPGTRVVDVGRRAACRSSAQACTQAMTIALLVREARSGMRVVRLHAGDPFVFGRAGEEVDALREEGIGFEIVPGVSAALAAPAAAGIPVTRRGESRGFSVRTGHTEEGYSKGELPKSAETVVVLMGLGAASEILSNLVREGHGPDTPAVAVSNATRKDQRIVIGTLSTLADRIEAARLESPATLIVGEVARRAARSEPARASEVAA